MAQPLDKVVIGFGYAARQGKDTAVQAIIDHWGQQYAIQRIGLADVLKQEVNAAAVQAGGMLGLFTKFREFTGRDLPSWVKYESDPDMTDPLCPLGKQRTLLQWWGSEYRRAQDSFYWVKALDKQVRASSARFILIPDIRFFNEAYWIKSVNGFTVKVERTGYTDLLASGHHSECELANYVFDIEIRNRDGELEQTKEDARRAFEVIVGWLTPPETY